MFHRWTVNVWLSWTVMLLYDLEWTCHSLPNNVCNFSFCFTLQIHMTQTRTKTFINLRTFWSLCHTIIRKQTERQKWLSTQNIAILGVRKFPTFRTLPSHRWSGNIHKQIQNPWRMCSSMRKPLKNIIWHLKIYITLQDDSQGGYGSLAFWKMTSLF